MKGTLKNTANGWMVIFKDSNEPTFFIKNKPYITTTVMKELPLHPDDVQQIQKDSLIFDNIEARIAAYPDVNFTIERYCDVHKTDPQTGPCTLDCAWDTKQYAKLLTIQPQVSDDFQIGPHGAFEYQDEFKPDEWKRIFNHVEVELHVELPERLKNFLMNTYYPPVKRNTTYDKKVPYQPEKEKCDCGNMAIYCYMPGYSGGGNPYHCSDCVSRGCTCNFKYIGTHGMPEGEEGKDWKWVEEYGKKVWVELDEKGREYPCAEHMWDPEGFDKD